MTLDECANQLRAALSAISISYVDEKELQETLHGVIVALWPHATREPRLTKHDIPDFTVPIGGGNVFVLEVKTRCPRMEIMRQLKRYNDISIVQGTLLICVKPVPMMPADLSGKPVRQLALFTNVL